MLKGIIFDIDGVIVDLTHFHFLSWYSVFSQHGVTLTKKQWEQVVGKPRLEIATTIAKLNHFKVTLEQLKAIANEKNKLFIHLIESGLTPDDVANGIRRLVDDAKKKKYKLAVVSTSTNAVLEMKRIGLYSKFDYVCNSNDPSLKSADTDERQLVSPLALALKKLNLEGSECIGFENNVKGIEQYQAYGIYAVGIAHFRDDIKEKADFAVDLPEQVDLDEIAFNYYKNDNEDEEEIIQKNVN